MTPNRFAAMPFGGGGALHTGALIREVGLDAALVPRFPGVTSALGCVVADMRHDRVQTVNRLLGDLDVEELDAAMRDGATALEELLAEAGAIFISTERQFELDMLYLGQTHTVAVPIELNDAPISAQSIQSAFEQAYRAAYGRLLADIPVRVMNYRIAVIGRRPHFDMSAFIPENGKPAAACRIGERQTYSGGRSWPTPVFDRLALEVDETIAGPALLEQDDTTIFVDPGLVARVGRVRQSDHQEGR